MHTFLDEATIFVHGGDGGAGSMHFHREKYVPRGGPDGGDGGRGGAVILRAERGLNTLFNFRHKRRFSAEIGQAGGQSKMHGRNGKDVVVDVPTGTVVRDSETGEILADLREDGQTIVVARGGQGGLGNVHFKSSTNQAPHFAEKGEPGQERWLDLELKLIADVGLIGLPNAGKSTLLSVISAARPKIADYPFTTLTPNLGVVDVDGEYSFVAADIPGLIEGAHEGVGLGHEFLRHIERTRVLVHVIDASASDPMEAFDQVQDELRQYDPDLLEKPEIVAVNKLDIPEAEARFEELQAAFKEKGFEAVPLSAATNEGVRQLLYRVADLLREAQRETAPPEEAEPEVIAIKPPADHFEVERKRRTFYVRGEAVERLTVMTDTDSDEAMHRLQQRLKRMGVIAALERAGAQDGSRVVIGEVELTWDSSFEPEVRSKRKETTGRRG